MWAQLASSFLGGGGGGSSASATATSGPATSGAGSVNVGGFNPPAFGGGNQQLIALGVVAVAVVLLVIAWRR